MQDAAELQNLPETQAAQPNLGLYPINDGDRTILKQAFDEDNVNVNNWNNNKLIARNKMQEAVDGEWFDNKPDQICCEGEYFYDNGEARFYNYEQTKTLEVRIP